MVKKITKAKIIKQYTNNYSKWYYLRELAQTLDKPHQTLKSYVETLVNEKILIKNKRNNITEYGLNFKNKKVYDYLTIAEKERWLENKNNLLNMLYEKLSKYFEKNIFVIFGSAVKEIKKGPDIDLLIIGKSDLSKTLTEFEEVYNKKIHKIQVNSLKDVSLSLTKEIYKKHIILNNTESIIRFFGGLHEQNKLV